MHRLLGRPSPTLISCGSRAWKVASFNREALRRSPTEYHVNVTKQLAVLDRATALERVGDDLELLQEMAQLYLDEYPSQLEALRVAVHKRDAKGVERAAHSLKGSVGNFGAFAAHSAALAVEMLGRHADLSHVDAAMADLEAALTDLHPEMELLLQG